MVTITVPYLTLTLTFLPILVTANNNIALRVIFKPLLSCFFLYAALQALAIHRVQTQPDAAIPPFCSLSSSFDWKCYPSSTSHSVVEKTLTSSPAIVFQPTWGLLTFLYDLSLFHQSLLIGLGLSWIGDVCLLAFHSTLWFTVGLVAFLSAHVFYLISYCLRIHELGGTIIHPSGALDQTFSILASTYIIIGILTFYYVKSGNMLEKEPHMRPAVKAYITVISAMVLAASCLALLGTSVATTTSTSTSTTISTMHPLSTSNPTPPINNNMPSTASIPSTHPSTSTSTSPHSTSSLSTPSSPLSSAKAPASLMEKQPLIQDAYVYVSSSIRLYLDRITPSFLHPMMNNIIGPAPSPSSPSVLLLPNKASLQSLFLFTGAIMFYLSDLFVARERFVKTSFYNSCFGLPLYFIAQILLAASLQF